MQPQPVHSRVALRFWQVAASFTESALRRRRTAHRILSASPVVLACGLAFALGRFVGELILRYA